MVTDGEGRVRQIQVKQSNAASNWIWGAFRMPGRVLHELHSLWKEPGRGDEYIGTLVNEYLSRGGQAVGVRAGSAYVDVGTLHGYREAIKLLGARPAPAGGREAVEPRRRGDPRQPRDPARKLSPDALPATRPNPDLQTQESKLP